MVTRPLSVLPYRVQRPHADVRLFCLPYAGGNATLYRTWGASLPEHIEVCPIELPGRGVRFREAPIAVLTTLVDRLSDDLADVLDRPFALFGHSMGARIALELARRRPDRLVHLFASAALPPHRMTTRFAPLANAGDAELIAELRRWGNTPDEVLENEELLELTLPILRADIALLEGADSALEPRVACPLTVLVGTDDRDVPAHEAREWTKYTTSPITRIRTVDSGHLFVTEPAGRQRVLDAVVEALPRF